MRTVINLECIQIKSLEKAQKLAYALNIIEEECGIKSCRITITNPFICSWIDLEKLNKTDMEILLKGILLKLK